MLFLISADGLSNITSKVSKERAKWCVELSSFIFGFFGFGNHKTIVCDNTSAEVKELKYM